MRKLSKRKLHSDINHVGGYLTITKLIDGKVVFTTPAMPNKVVSSSGYGRNLIARQLAGDTTFSMEIDSASIGTSSTAAADGQTNLVASAVSGISITNMVVANNVLTVDVFVASGELPNGTYREFGLFCNGRLFARIVISPDYTKGTNEDTLFTYTLTLAG
jgi:hypothetical protein